IGAANTWSVTNGIQTAANGAFVVARDANTTANVFMVSGTLNTTGYVTFSRMIIGANGQGTFTVTNGLVRNNTAILGDQAAGRGTLTIAGPSTLWTNGGLSATFNLGSLSSGNSVIISNGAKLVTGNGTIGTSATGVNNTMLITDANS